MPRDGGGVYGTRGVSPSTPSHASPAPSHEAPDGRHGDRPRWSEHPAATNTCHTSGSIQATAQNRFVGHRQGCRPMACCAWLRLGYHFVRKKEVRPLGRRVMKSYSLSSKLCRRSCSDVGHDVRVAVNFPLENIRSCASHGAAELLIMTFTNHKLIKLRN
jgi:hypothetical protein